VFFKRDVVLAQEYLGFCLLNLFDLFLTGYIFKHGGLEANSVAAIIYQYGHPLGFAIYKFLLVLVVILACEGISIKSTRKARLIVTFGCLIYLIVVFWESYLVFTHITGPLSTPHPA
jgi:hypothetical protein